MLETKGTENQGAILLESARGLDQLFSFRGKAAQGNQTDLTGTQNADGADFVMLLKDYRSALDGSRYPSSQYVETSGVPVSLPKNLSDAVGIHEETRTLSPASEIFLFPIDLQPIFLQAREEKTVGENNQPEDDPMIKGNINALSLTLGMGMLSAGKDSEASDIVVNFGKEGQAAPDEGTLGALGNSEKPIDTLVPDRPEFRLIRTEDQGRMQFVRTILAEQVSENIPVRTEEGLSKAVSGRAALDIVLKSGEDEKAMRDEDRQKVAGNPEEHRKNLVPGRQEFRLIGAEGQGRKQFSHASVAADLHDKIPAPLTGAEKIGQGKVFSSVIRVMQEGGISGDFFPAGADVRKVDIHVVDKKSDYLNSSNPDRTDIMAAAVASPFIKTQDTPFSQAQSLVDQVTEQLPQVLGRGSERVRITLTPPHLGSLDMEVLVRDNRVQVLLTTENRDVQQSLLVNVEKLKEGLQQQGLQVDGLNVLLNDGRHGQDGALGGGHYFWQDKNPSKPGMKEAEGQAVPSGLEPLVQGESRGRSAEGINIFV